ncbi:hypothetical protein BaRGS_00016695 [Batillaria attramentaria]|uniref:Uncharacterized protein n=1 Tax=Batillaria attramentaria TaxID=370345 RepID=A0ABD0KY73_9CAEN
MHINCLPPPAYEQGLLHLQRVGLNSVYALKSRDFGKRSPAVSTRENGGIVSRCIYRREKTVAEISTGKESEFLQCVNATPDPEV